VSATAPSCSDTLSGDVPSLFIRVNEGGPFEAEARRSAIWPSTPAVRFFESLDDSPSRSARTLRTGRRLVGLALSSFPDGIAVSLGCIPGRGTTNTGLSDKITALDYVLQFQNVGSDTGTEHPSSLKI
jgi:hypothetical protein